MTDEELSKLIKRYLNIRCKSNTDLAKKLGISRSTYYRKIEKPTEFTYAELKKIFDFLKIPTTERYI